VEGLRRAGQKFGGSGSVEVLPSEKLSEHEARRGVVIPRTGREKFEACDLELLESHFGVA
jgi:hypothetical protein